MTKQCYVYNEIVFVVVVVVVVVVFVVVVVVVAAVAVAVVVVVVVVVVVGWEKYDMIDEYDYINIILITFSLKYYLLSKGNNLLIVRNNLLIVRQLQYLFALHQFK